MKMTKANLSNNLGKYFSDIGSIPLNPNEYESFSLLKNLCYERKNNDPYPRTEFIVKCIEYFASESNDFSIYLKKEWLSGNNKKMDFLNWFKCIKGYSTQNPSGLQDRILANEVLNLLKVIAEEIIKGQKGKESFYWAINNQDELAAELKEVKEDSQYVLLKGCYTYKPWKGRHPTEEFFTQVLGFVLCKSNCPKFSWEFLKKLNYCYGKTHRNDPIFPDFKKSYLIQSEIPLEGTNRIDLVIKDHSGKIKIAIENKVKAPYDQSQIVRYGAIEDKPIVFSITYKNDCDEEVFFYTNQENHLNLPEHQWGGHLFWYDLMELAKHVSSKIVELESEEKIYLKYFIKLIESLYTKFDLKTTIPYDEENQNENTDKFRRYILEEFASYVKDHANTNFPGNIKNLYDLNIKKEYNSGNSWNGNDKNGKNVKLFHLLIKPKVDLKTFNKRVRLDLPLTAIRIWFKIEDSLYVHDENWESKFIKHNLQITVDLIARSKGDLKNDEWLKIIKDLGGISKNHFEELDVFIEPETYSLGELESKYPSKTGDWKESLMQHLEATLKTWDQKGYFEEIIKWWGADLNSDNIE